MARKTYRKIITSDKLIKKINKSNMELAERFLKTKSRDLSPKSIEVYRSNLNIFFVWNLQHNNNKHFTEIKKLEFSDFFNYAAEEMDMGSARLNNMRSTLSSLSIFIEKFYDEEYPNFRNVILSIIDSAPKEQRREKTVLTDEQVEKLLEHLSKTDSQQACWLALAVCSGARFSELLNFEVDLIDKNKTAFGDLFLETTRPIRTKGRGKGGKMLHKYILRDKFLPFFDDWIEKRAIILKENGIENNSLFIQSNGKPVTTSTVQNWTKGFEKFLGVNVYTHSFRHFFVTLLSRKNIPHHLIKAIVGWEDVGMVEVYNDQTIGEMDFPELENLKNL